MDVEISLDEETNWQISITTISLTYNIHDTLALGIRTMGVRHYGSPQIMTIIMFPLKGKQLSNLPNGWVTKYINPDIRWLFNSYKIHSEYA